MPYAPKVGCLYPLCRELIEHNVGGYCIKHKKANRKQYNTTRGTSAERGYGSRWNKARVMYLRRFPLCAECLENNVVCASECVDHKVPHRGNYDLFWDESNWQALCTRHHNTKSGKGD